MYKVITEGTGDPPSSLITQDINLAAAIMNELWQLPLMEIIMAGDDITFHFKHTEAIEQIAEAYQTNELRQNVVSFASCLRFLEQQSTISREPIFKEYLPPNKALAEM